MHASIPPSLPPLATTAGVNYLADTILHTQQRQAYEPLCALAWWLHLRLSPETHGNERVNASPVAALPPPAVRSNRE
eukprot:1029515-Rhodomonas_salina.3